MRQYRRRQKKALQRAAPICSEVQATDGPLSGDDDLVLEARRTQARGELPRKGSRGFPVPGKGGIYEGFCHWHDGKEALPYFAVKSQKAAGGKEGACLQTPAIHDPA